MQDFGVVADRFVVSKVVDVADHCYHRYAAHLTRVCLDTEAEHRYLDPYVTDDLARESASTANNNDCFVAEAFDGTRRNVRDLGTTLEVLRNGARANHFAEAASKAFSKLVGNIRTARSATWTPLGHISNLSPHRDFKTVRRTLQLHYGRDRAPER